MLAPNAPTSNGPAIINALHIIDDCYKDWMVVRVRFPCKTPSHAHYDRSVFCDYDELVLLTAAWKMHGSLSYIVVNIRIELASNSARHMGGKLAMARHPETCLISKSGT